TCSNAARQAVFDRNRDYGNDLVWVRVNATARPGCYPWQGKVISTEGRSGMTHDLDDKPIPFYSIHDTTYGQPDGLWGINCHHGPPNVFLPGLSSIRGEVPSADDNAAAYELTQRQRQLERQVRYAKREAAMLDAAGDKEGFDQAALRVKQRQQALRDFAEANNLPLSGDRTQVMVYNRSVAGKAAAVSAKYSRYHYSKDGTIVVTDDWKDRKHASPPGTYKPYAVMETVSGKHRQVDRTFYDAHGVILRQVHSKAHLKWQHPDYANGGAHAHDYISGKRIDYDGKDGRELTESEVTENADIIDAAGVERSPV
ncbi:MAG: phage minor capsid protein, partial [Aristaeellaceae bacterium]